MRGAPDVEHERVTIAAGGAAEVGVYVEREIVDDDELGDGRAVRVPPRASTLLFSAPVARLAGRRSTTVIQLAPAAHRRSRAERRSLRCHE